MSNGTLSLDQMPTIREIHLTEVIAKVYTIGQSLYNGKIYDNVLSIFDALDLEEQKVLIRATLGLYVASTTDIILDQNIIDSGDSSALLIYLSKMRSGQDNSGVITTREDLDSAKTKPKETLNLNEIWGFGMKLAIGITVFSVIIHIAVTTLSDDPNAMASAKIYIKILEIIKLVMS